MSRTRLRISLVGSSSPPMSRSAQGSYEAALPVEARRLFRVHSTPARFPRIGRPMSAYGTKQIFRSCRCMSAFGGKAEYAPQCPLMTQSRYAECACLKSLLSTARGSSSKPGVLQWPSVYHFDLLRHRRPRKSAPRLRRTVIYEPRQCAVLFGSHCGIRVEPRTVGMLR